MSVSLRYGSIFLLQVIGACLLSTSGAAQPQMPRLPAPPPLRLVSRSERSQLDEARDAKARLHATIALAEDHLMHAENFTEQKKFDEASAEVGSYIGLIGDLRDYISKLNHDKTSTRDICRHLEMDVRPHLPRLAVIRRTTPVSYSLYIKEAEEFIKDTRAEALDSFYGHSVLREPAPAKTPAPVEPSKAPAAADSKDSPQTKHP
ncbi:MAG TPA: hypothetical protein DC054_24575 [Blastocatellia bacterium]|nr:hypothetical protein [Blastocatellia bacterium]